MHDVRQFLRANPQVVVLLVICLVLGVGTFLVVLFAIASSPSHHVTGDPDGSLLRVLHAAIRVLRTG
jgi:hypothetical protein